jgi:hypothetical protein
LLLAAFARDLILGRRRSFARDGRVMLDGNPHPRQITGSEHIPRTGSFVVVMNHYSRRGLRPYHCAFAVSATVAEARPDGTEIRWAFASEMYGQRFVRVPIPLWLVRWVFRRVALVYDLIIVPRREQLVAGRAMALRRFWRALDGGPVGLTPETVGQGVLVAPPPGAGLLLARLAGRAPLLPVGTWEDDAGALHVRFGAPFTLALRDGASREARDEEARTQTMVAIGGLMPRVWWGAYEQEIAMAGGVGAGDA